MTASSTVADDAKLTHIPGFMSSNYLMLFHKVSLGALTQSRLFQDEKQVPYIGCLLNGIYLNFWSNRRCF